MRCVAKRAKSDMNPKHEAAQDNTHRPPSRIDQGQDLPTPLNMAIKNATSVK